MERWMESDVFDVIDEERRKEYHTILDDMIKYGFSRDMDTIFVYFRGLIEQEKETRRRQASKKKIEDFFRERGDQGDKDV